MYTVLICEDEPLIALGLQKVIRESQLPVGRIYLAEDGRQALEQFAAGDVQIVLTDIEMPELSGLGFLEQALRERPNLQCVIISGYSEFSYAQTAIKLGVSDYLLKPIDNEELCRVLARCIETIEQLDRQNELLPKLLCNQLSQVLESPISEEAFFDVPGSALEAPAFACLSFHLMRGETVLSKAWEPVKGFLEQTAPTSVLLAPDGREFRAILNFSPEKIAFEEIQEALSEFLSELHRKHGLSLCCGVGPAVEDPMHFAQSAQAAEEALCGRFGSCHPPVLVKGGEQALPAASEAQLESAISRLVRTVSDCAVSKIAADAEQLFALLSLSPKSVRRTLNEVKSLLDPQETAFPSAAEILGRCDSVHVLKSQVNQLLKEYCQAKLEGQAKNYDAVTRAVAYIEKNYKKEINLATLANVVSMNYTYFSGVFKKRTGMSITQYLSKIRIERSKELLSGTDQKIYEISHMVGFPDDHYFVKVFKRFEGITPSEYRQNLNSASSSKHF